MAKCSNLVPAYLKHKDCAYVQDYHDLQGDWLNRSNSVWGCLQLGEELPGVPVIFNDCVWSENGKLNPIKKVKSSPGSIVFTNRQSIYIIGRDNACDVVVNQPSVSGKHFQIHKEIPDELNAVRVNINDTSLNGTYVNGSLLKRGKVAVLYHGDEICIPLGKQQLFLKFKFYSPLQDTIVDEGRSWPLQKNYKRFCEIGIGAFSVVWLAQSVSGEKVAVKTIAKKRYGARRGKRDFTLEARILNELSHDNIVRFIEYLETPEMLYITMELVRGRTVRQLVLEDGSLQVQQIKVILKQMISVILFLNEKNIVHRDLKPDNFMITLDDKLKLIDFGDIYTTSYGNSAFVAPEVLTDKITYDDKVDSYSLGATLYFMFCGVPPRDNIYINSQTIVKWPEKIGIESQARDLVRLLLLHDPAQRFSVADVQHHPWITMSNEIPPVNLDASVPFFSESKRYSEINIPWAIFNSLQSRVNAIILTKNPSWIRMPELNNNTTDFEHLEGQCCQISMISDTLLSICNFGYPVRANGILLEKYTVYAISFGFIVSFTSPNTDGKEYHYRILPSSSMKSKRKSGLVLKYYNWDLISDRPETHVPSPVKYLYIFQPNLPILALKSFNTRYLQNIMPITFDRLLIGRGKLCTVVVAHQCISRCHCVIHLSEAGLDICNLRSGDSGTWVNDNLLGKSENARLKAGDIVTLYKFNSTGIISFEVIAISDQTQPSKK